MGCFRLWGRGRGEPELRPVVRELGSGWGSDSGKPSGAGLILAGAPQPGMFPGLRPPIPDRQPLPLGGLLGFGVKRATCQEMNLPSDPCCRLVFRKKFRDHITQYRCQ